MSGQTYPEHGPKIRVSKSKRNVRNVKPLRLIFRGIYSCRRSRCVGFGCLWRRRRYSTIRLCFLGLLFAFVRLLVLCHRWAINYADCWLFAGGGRLRRRRTKWRSCSRGCCARRRRQKWDLSLFVRRFHIAVLCGETCRRRRSERRWHTRLDHVRVVHSLRRKKKSSGTPQFDCLL
jgi:hypothetical protein